MDTRPVQPEDISLLEPWREAFPHNVLDMPHGYVQMPGTATRVATHENKLLAGMTATFVVLIDPYIHDPALSPRESHDCLLRLEEEIRAAAEVVGAMDVYLAVADVPEMKAFHKLVQREGYQPTAEGCIIYRRPLAFKESK